MASVPFALSIHHFISSVGADAGFAAIIGLAILILLWFAQARETATLREHAYEATERIQRLEARLAQMSRPTAAPAPAPAEASSVPAVSAVRPAAVAGGGAAVAARTMAPAAPAGVGAPALAAATRLIPASPPVSAAPSPVAAAPAAAPAAGRPGPAAPGAPVAAPVGAGAAAGAAAASAGGASAVQSPPPATAAGAANGGGTGVGERPRPVSQLPPRSANRAPGSAATRRPAAATAGRVPPSRSPSRISRALLAAIGLVGVIVVVGVLLLVTSGGSNTRTTSTNAKTSTRSRHATRLAVAPSSVTVAVLNGTATNDLAHRIAAQLTGIGYKVPAASVVTAPDQTHTTTIVAYLPGYRKDAEAVATSLKVSPSAVQPVDPSSQQVACSGMTTCTINVVATIGQDLANRA